MSTAEKLAAIAANVPLVYAAGKAGCIAQHFVTKVKGDGSTALRVKVPFVPDYVAAICFDPLVVAQPGHLMNFSIDLRAISYMAGVCTSTRNGLPYSSILSHVGLGNRYAVDEDGTVTVVGLPSGEGPYAGRFLAQSEYVFVAAKHTQLTDAARIEEVMQLISGRSLSLIMSRKIITGAFPGADEEDAETGLSKNEQWNSLKQQYASNCTIAFQ